MRIISLASGSKGNACCIESCGRTLLIDCGLSCRELRRRAAEAGVSLDTLEGVIITHSHDDHICGLATFHKKFADVPLFANMMTAESTAWRMKMDETAFVPFENGQMFSAGPFEIDPFSIPHDTSDPVGYMVRAEGITYFHATDIGTPLDSIGLHLKEADVATLESNHDPVMLRSSGRPPSLVQRIAGPRGHLSNGQACELVKRFASPRLTRLALGHLSAECNAPHLAEQSMRAALDCIGRADVPLLVLRQDAPVEVFAGGCARAGEIMV